MLKADKMIIQKPKSSDKPRPEDADEPSRDVAADVLQARKVLEQDRLIRAGLCRKEVEAVCAKYNCVIEAVFTIRADGITPSVEVVPK